MFKPGMLLLIASLASLHLNGQDILVIHGHAPEKVKILEANEGTVSYMVESDTSGIIRHISTSVIDSLRFSDGRSVNFIVRQYGLPKIVARNNISVEMIGLATGLINIEYEHIVESGRAGLFLGIMMNPGRVDYLYKHEYQDFLSTWNYNAHPFFVKFGYNLYHFNHSLERSRNSRVSSGFSIIVGSYNERSYDYTRNFEMRITNKVAGKLVWNVKGAVYFTNSLRISGGLDISLLPFLSSVCPQISLSTGF